jgi:predicted dehydrogenase
MKDSLSWGIIGTGNIAHVFAEGLRNSATGKLTAVASRKSDSAEKFGEKFGIQSQYSDYTALIKDPAIQAVYIALPHPLHAEWVIKATDQGKHVLCEKPMAMTFQEAVKVIGAVKRNDVFFMEAFMYRCHPQTAKLVELLQDKLIGEIRVIQATFSYDADPLKDSRAYNKNLGAGGILDVGCYPVSMARLIAGASLGRPFANPVKVEGVAYVSEEHQIDEWAIGCLKFENNIIAQVATGIHLNQENVVRIFGSKGDIFITSPWVPGGRGPGATKILFRNERGANYQEIIIESQTGLYTNEADIVAKNIMRRQASAMEWEDSLGNMRALDQWRQAIGVSYSADAF